MLSLIRELWRDQKSAAAMEFYFVATVLVIIIIGVFDLSEAMIYYQETYDAAHSIAASASNIAVQAGTGATNLTFNQVQLAESEIWGQIPGLRGNFQDGNKSVTISSIVFEPLGFDPTSGGTCQNPSTTNPCYTPDVVWSVAYVGGAAPTSLPPGPFTVSSSSAAHDADFIAQPEGDTVYGNSYTCGAQPNSGPGTTGTSQCVTGIIGTNSGQAEAEYANPPLRPCDGNATIPASTKIIGSLNQTLQNGGTASDLTSLRTLNLTDGQNLNGSQTGSFAPPPPILVVDVHFQYVPLLGLFWNNKIDYWTSAYWPVRSVEGTVVTTNAQGAETITPLTLYKQFTTITASTLYPAESAKYYCLNNTFVSP